MPTKIKVTRNPGKTRLALLKAAENEFETQGYEGTNTNRIAAHAGYAPQTFYRHFRNKLSIFLAVYAQWTEDGIVATDRVTSAEDTARLTIAHHKKFMRFRRTLRHLSVVEPEVRAARAASRAAQIGQIRTRLPHLEQVPTEIMLAKLLAVERLSDACAEGEFVDLGFTEAEAETQLTNMIQTMFGPSSGNKIV